MITVKVVSGTEKVKIPKRGTEILRPILSCLEI